MDVAEKTTSPAFHRLPVELLTMILDHIISESGTFWRCLLEFPTLKNLRLACRQYAYLPRLNAALFHSVRLVASPQHAQIAETTDLSHIKRYVKRLVFEPSKFSWLMTYDLFVEILMLGPLKDVCERQNEILRGKMDRGEDCSGLSFLPGREIMERGWKAFMKMYWEGETPFSEAAIKEGYQRYMQNANDTKQLFEDGKLQKAWIKALQQLPDVSMFRIGFWDFDSALSLQHREATKGKGWKELGCEIYEHDHSWMHGHDEWKCLCLQEPVGEALVRAAFASLDAAGSAVTQLDLNCVVDGYFTWIDDDQQSAVDLSRLHTLLFRPQGVDDDRLDLLEQACATSRCGRAVTKLLEKCATSIKELELLPSVSNFTCDWPPTSGFSVDNHHIITLPALERFKTGADLNLAGFAEFLHRAPSLKHLELNCCNEGSGGGKWRDLWRAIRHHPSRMMLEFDQIPCSDVAEISMTHFTGEKSNDEEDHDPDDPWISVNYSLGNYLSNKGGWDKSCRMWFEGEGESDTDVGEEYSEAERDNESDTEDSDAEAEGTQFSRAREPTISR